MNIILDVDAIRSPLTGIGRYSFELATRLSALEGINNLSFYSQKGWVKDIQKLLISSPTQAKIRHYLGNYRYVRWAHQKFSSLQHYRLLKQKNTLFHGTRFFLPNFSGKTVATIHDLTAFRYPQFHPKERVRMLHQEIPRTIRRADYLITDSEFVRKELIECWNCLPEKVEAIPLGVSEVFRPMNEKETYPVLQKLQLSYASYILCVATIEPRKNIKNLIKAYSCLPIVVRNHFPLVLVGDSGWKSGDIHEEIHRKEQEGWLKYLGYFTESSLPFLVAGAKGFVYPPYDEGFGLPLLESMACGIPVVTSNASSLSEVASQGAAATVAPDDIDALASAIFQLIENNRWGEMARKNSSYVARDYSWNKTASKTAEVYRKIW